MQKIFRKYMLYILSGSMFVMLVISLLFSVETIKRQRSKEFNRKIDQIIDTIENNKRELIMIKENLNADYLTRAKATAYMVANNPDMVKTVTELKKVAKLLDVDEVHIIDENGVVIHSSVPKYIGIDFHDGRQTRAFLPILESSNKDSCVIQEALPNSAENKMMKYVGVARQDQKGIVQIGLEPTRQLEAQERNTYQYLFSRFPTSTGEEFFVINSATGEMIGHSAGDTFLGSDVRERIQIEELLECKNGKFKQTDKSEEQFIVAREYNGEIIGVSVSKDILYSGLWRSVSLILFCILVVELHVILSMNLLVKRKVVDGIHGILEKLGEITNGNLDTVVDVGGNPEFEDLSGGINSMVKSITNSTDRITKIIDISGIPLAAFEYQDNMSGVFVTSGLRALLNLSKKEAAELYKNPEVFYQRIRQIMKSPIEGETNIFQMGEYRYISIQLTGDEAGYLGVVADVTDAVEEKKRMQYENVHDQLTGLCRYQYFKQTAEKILQKKLPDEVCAAVMLDLDAFKSINDTYGHGVGDEYLKKFAQFTKALPKEHWVTARRSGDEFCLMGYGYSDREEVRQLLKQFWEALRENNTEIAKGVKSSISVSGGVAWAEACGQEVDSLLQNADEALYHAKRNSKGNFAEF